MTMRRTVPVLVAEIVNAYRDLVRFKEIKVRAVRQIYSLSKSLMIVFLQ